MEEYQRKARERRERKMRKKNRGRLRLRVCFENRMIQKRAKRKGNRNTLRTQEKKGKKKVK